MIRAQKVRVIVPALAYRLPPLCIEEEEAVLRQRRAHALKVPENGANGANEASVSVSVNVNVNMHLFSV
jgi:hypothetical protein